MCSCQREFALRFLPHQLGYGISLGTVKVANSGIATRHPWISKLNLQPVPRCSADIMSESSNAWSGSRRYSRREIALETMRRISDLQKAVRHEGHSSSERSGEEVHESIERAVIEEIKRPHEIAPT